MEFLQSFKKWKGGITSKTLHEARSEGTNTTSKVGEIKDTVERSRVAQSIW